MLNLGNVAVIGGGRWARVLTEVLCGLVDRSVGISVHSTHNAEGMAAWVASRDWTSRVEVSERWIPSRSGLPGAVIVANAARDHVKSVEPALQAGMAVLVEKPVALTAADAQRLGNLAASQKARLAAGHVFLFARYLRRFVEAVHDAKGPQHIYVEWTDPRVETRYGEQKRYDPGVPVLADSLPHVAAGLSTLTAEGPQRCEAIKVHRGGAVVELELRLGSTPCSVRLARNSSERRRIIVTDTAAGVLRLDFSQEPGIISSRGAAIVADPQWDVRPRPVAEMLAAFLEWAAGGDGDSRLDFELGLRACRLIDETMPAYRAQVMSWLANRLASSQTIDEDLQYGITEAFYSSGNLAKEEIRARIDALLKGRTVALLLDHVPGLNSITEDHV